MQNYEKHLYFLIPFYIFNYETRFREIEQNDLQLKEIENEYKKISLRLAEALMEGFITEYEFSTIIEMAEKVLVSIARNHKLIREGVKNSMGGKVLEYRTKSIFNAGKNEGWIEGKAEGKTEGTMLMALKCHQYGIDDSTIAEMAGVSAETVRKWLHC